VPNEFMARDFAERTGRSTAIIRNPVSDTVIDENGLRPAISAAPPVSIVYSGTVYHAQADAFANLVRAADLLDGGVVIDIYTSQTAAQVAAHGIAGRHVRIFPYVDQTESYAIQRRAGILFLPLAFHSSIPEVVRSSAPAKLGEYLASGRPLLVHAPADTFVANHIRAHNAGIVVDALNLAQLIDAIDRMITTPAEIARTIENATRLAELYRASLARETFWNLLTQVADRERLQ
jgi:glycosyltransferase involved in cell wall biosynthesis